MADDSERQRCARRRRRRDDISRRLERVDARFGRAVRRVCRRPVLESHQTAMNHDVLLLSLLFAIAVFFSALFSVD